MTEMALQSLSGAPDTCNTSWNSMNWKQAKVHVNRLQMRITKTSRGRQLSQ